MFSTAQLMRLRAPAGARELVVKARALVDERTKIPDAEATRIEIDAWLGTERSRSP